MSDLTSQLNLPADPPEAERSTPSITATATGFDIAVPATTAPDVTTPEVVAPAAPSVSVDAAGVPHVTIPLTKKTKAHVGTAVAGVIVAAEVATAYLLPDGSPYTAWVQAGVGVVGLLATFLGISLPTNLPVNLKRGSHSA